MRVDDVAGVEGVFIKSHGMGKRDQGMEIMRCFKNETIIERKPLSILDLGGNAFELSIRCSYFERAFHLGTMDSLFIEQAVIDGSRANIRDIELNIRNGQLQDLPGKDLDSSLSKDLEKGIQKPLVFVPERMVLFLIVKIAGFAIVGFLREPYPYKRPQMAYLDKRHETLSAEPIDTGLQAVARSDPEMMAGM
jgi:hypothetical protein